MIRNLFLFKKIRTVVSVKWFIYNLIESIYSVWFNGFGMSGFVNKKGEGSFYLSYICHRLDFGAPVLGVTAAKPLNNNKI